MFATRQHSLSPVRRSAPPGAKDTVHRTPATRQNVQNTAWHQLATNVRVSSEGRVAQQIQRQTSSSSGQPPGPGQTAQTPNLLRIYSFGPSGAGRMETASGTTIFSPAAPVDAQGNELVQAGTTAQPKLFRFGRYFSLDERSRPHPPPVPSCSIKYVTEWTPDDGSAQTKSTQNSSTTYYQPGETLGHTLDSQCSFLNDRPGRFASVYVFTSPTHWLLLGHGVHFVNDPSAPVGSTVLPGGARSCQ
jgi:hypothetical protein